MKHSRIATLAISILFLLNTAITIYIDAQQLDIPRHTAGFPHNKILYNEEMLNKLLDIVSNTSRGRYNESEIGELYRDIESLQESVEGTDYTLYRDLQGVADVIRTLNKSSLEAVDELYRDIENGDLKTIFRDVIAKYGSGSYISPIEVVKLCKTVTEMYRGGLLDSGDALRALEILYRISDTLNYQDIKYSLELERSSIIREIMDRLADLELQMPPQQYTTRRNPINEETNQVFREALGGTPSIQMPIGIPPSVETIFSFQHLKDILFIPVIVVLAIALILLIPRLLRYVGVSRYLALRRIARVSRDRYVGGGLRKSIANYWLAVDFIERRFGVAKNVWMTHREHLDRVKRALVGEVPSLLDRLTRIYEIVRFGGVEDDSLDRESEDILNRMVEEHD